MPWSNRWLLPTRGANLPEPLEGCPAGFVHWMAWRLHGQGDSLCSWATSMSSSLCSWLRCHVKSKIVSGTSKINCKFIHSTAHPSSGATSVFLGCSMGPEDYFDHCCSSTGHPPSGRVVRDERAESPLLSRGLPWF